MSKKNAFKFVVKLCSNYINLTHQFKNVNALHTSDFVLFSREEFTTNSGTN